MVKMFVEKLKMNLKKCYDLCSLTQKGMTSLEDGM